MIDTRFLFLIISYFLVSTLASQDKKENPKEISKELVEDEKKILNQIPEELDTVYILGTKEEQFKLPGSATQINAEELNLFEYDDIHRVLSRVPGVYFREEDGYGLRPNIGIRGGSSERSSKITLMEDGVLFAPAPYSAPAAYFFPLMTRMVGVEIFKGPAAIQFGPNTIGGAINLVSKHIPLEKEGHLDLSYGSNNFLKGHISYGQTNGKIGFVAEMIHLQSDGFKDIDGGGDTGFNKDEGMVKLQYNFDDNIDFYQELQLKLSYAQEESNETYMGLSDEDFKADPYRRYAASEKALMDWTRSQVQLKHYLNYQDSIELNTVVYRQDFERNWRKMVHFKDKTALLDIITNHDAGAEAVYFQVLTGDMDSTGSDNLMLGDNKRQFISQGIQSDLSWTFDTSNIHHKLFSGIRMHYDEIKRNHTEDEYQMISGDLEKVDVPRITSKKNKESATVFASYIKYEMTWDKLILTPGLRFEYIAMESNDLLNETTVDDNYTVLLPGIGAFYEVTKNFGILGGVHEGFSPKAPGQEDDVDVEKSLNSELGFRWNTKNYSIESIAFYNIYSNLLGTTSFSSAGSAEEIDKQFNLDEVTIHGLEFSMSTDFSINESLSVPIELVYTYTSTEFNSSINTGNPIYGNVSEGDELPYVPSHTLNLSLGLKSKNWGISLNHKYSSESEEVSGQGETLSGKKTDDFFIVDFASYYIWKEKHRVYLKLDNIFDEEYIASRKPYGARPGKPFQAFVGYKFSF